MCGASEGEVGGMVGGGGCSYDGQWIDAHWEGGMRRRRREDAMIYSLNSPTRSSCLFADP